LGNGSLRRAVQTGDPQTGAYMAGEIAGMVQEEQSAQTIVQTVCQQADRLLNRKLEE